MKGVIAVFAVLQGAVAGCGGKVVEGVGGKDAMLASTNAAKQCEDAARDHDRPFYRLQCAGLTAEMKANCEKIIPDSWKNYAQHSKLDCK